MPRNMPGYWWTWWVGSLVAVVGVGGYVFSIGGGWWTGVAAMVGVSAFVLYLWERRKRKARM